MKNLKPVIFLEGQVGHYRENQYAQNLILKALSGGVTDVNELKKITGMKSAAEVYRTLDKMQLRKEYHAALSKAGISLDYIVGELKILIDKSTSEKIKLGSIQTVLKSIGLEKYDKQEEDSKSWEDLVIELTEKESEDGIVDALETNDYEVITPILPDAVKKRQEEEQAEADELYGR